MSYTSPIHPDNIRIDDANAHAFAMDSDDGHGRGYVPRDYEMYPAGTFAAPFPMPTIPRYEWTDRIEELDANKAWPRDIKAMAGFDSLNQGQTNFCWANAPVQCSHYSRAGSGQAHVPLSPASIGAPIKNYRNVGGWGSEALEYLIKYGAVPQSMWPANAIDRKYDTEETRAIRKDFQVTEWWELSERNFSQMVSCLIYGYAIAGGYNWWSHEVTLTKVYVVGKDEFEIDVDNSWGKSWGDEGHGRLTQSKATADEQICTRVCVVNE